MNSGYTVSMNQSTGYMSQCDSIHIAVVIYNLQQNALPRIGVAQWNLRAPNSCKTINSIAQLLLHILLRSTSLLSNDVLLTLTAVRSATRHTHNRNKISNVNMP